MKKLLLLLMLCIMPFASARVFDMQVVTPDTGCSVYGCVFLGDIDMNGYTIYNATFVNASVVEHDPIFTAQNASIWAAINSKYNASNPAGYITFANISDHWVNRTGDTMTGNLNMSDNNITDVDVLFVHNISGRSPIHILSDVISNNSITADTFFGNINGLNGTIYGVTITNGSIVNLHVTGSDAIFDGSAIFNGTVNASDFNLEGDNVWIHKDNRTFYFNETKLSAFIANNTNASSSNTSFIIKYYTGSNLTGSDGDTNRLLDVGMNATIINVDTFVLQPTWDYTTFGTIVTFLNNIWNDQIITVYGSNTIQSNNYLGSAFTGTDGTTGRTLNITGNQTIVVVDNFWLQEPIDYTHMGNLLTMNNELWNDQRVTIWVVN